MSFNPLPKPKKKTKEQKCAETLEKRREAQKRWRDKAIKRKREKMAENRKNGKYTSLPKRSKRVDQWNRIRTKILKPMFEKLGIVNCEIAHHLLVNGMITSDQYFERNRMLGFAHRHKRKWYRQFKDDEGKMLGDYNQVLLLGGYYHDMIEFNKELTERWFLTLRGEEQL